MSILKLKNVCYSYPGTTKKVLKDITAEFERGKVHAIMGKSGAGKSTLLSLLSGLDVAMDGTILCDGNDLSEIDRDKYRAQKVGVIFQGYNLLTNATAIDNIDLSMSISGFKQDKAKVNPYVLLDKVGIDRETAKRKVLKLSGGEQQRVGIARAIAHNPDIVVADEPTGNLDQDTRNAIINILSNLAHSENKCIIVVTHSKEVASYSDELWGLNGGQLSFIK